MLYNLGNIYPTIDYAILFISFTYSLTITLYGTFALLPQLNKSHGGHVGVPDKRV
jgi:hypothetical protein